MKKAFYPVAALVVLVLSGFSAYKAPELKISSDFSIKFISDDPAGKFEQFSGTIKFDPKDLAGSAFDITIPVKSINCGNGLQNRHAVSSKWFDAEKYPNITYKSKAITKTSTGYQVVGTLEIREIKKEYTIPFTFENNTFSGKFKANRNDFKIGKPGGHAEDILDMEVTVPVSN